MPCFAAVLFSVAYEFDLFIVSVPISGAIIWHMSMVLEYIQLLLLDFKIGSFSSFVLCFFVLVFSCYDSNFLA